MPFFKKEKNAGKKAKKAKKGSKKKGKEPPPPKPPGAGGEGEGEEEEDLELKMEATDADIFSSEVDALFASMKATMGAASDLPDVKFGKMGDEMAGEDDFKQPEEPEEPEPEPEPAPRPKRVKLTKEEKMAKMKAMREKQQAQTSAEGGEAEMTEEEREEAAVMKRCEELFEQYDADGGGDIDAEEFAALCYDMGCEGPGRKWPQPIGHLACLGR
jgi:hypothetical protein